MKYIKQFTVIALAAFLGEVFHRVIPFPIPAGIYGLLLLFLGLTTGLIKLSAIEEAANFLLEIMPLLFLPVIVNLITAGSELKALAIPVVLAAIPGTFVTFGVTGKVTELCLRLKGRGRKKDD